MAPSFSAAKGWGINRKEVMIADPANSLIIANADDFFTVFPAIGRNLKTTVITTVDKGAAFEIMGFEKKNLKISVKNWVLTVAGTRKKERKTKTAGSWSETCSRNRFTRSMTPPTGMEVKKIKISYGNGELTLILPRHKAGARE